MPRSLLFLPALSALAAPAIAQQVDPAQVAAIAQRYAVTMEVYSKCLEGAAYRDAVVKQDKPEKVAANAIKECAKVLASAHATLVASPGFDPKEWAEEEKRIKAEMTVRLEGEVTEVRRFLVGQDPDAWPPK